MEKSDVMWLAPKWLRRKGGSAAYTPFGAAVAERKHLSARESLYPSLNVLARREV